MIDSLLNSLKTQLFTAQQFTAQPSHNEKTKIEDQQYQYMSLKIPVEKPLPLASVSMENSFFLSKSDMNLTLLGLGTFLSFQAQGENRFSLIKSYYEKTLQQWKNKQQVPPIAFHAFAFDENDPMAEHWQGIPNTLLSIPFILIKEVNSCQTLLINIHLNQDSYEVILLQVETLLIEYLKQFEAPVESCTEDVKNKNNFISTEAYTTDAPSSDWLTLTHKAINEIQSGRIEKIVTSRRLTLRTVEKKIAGNLLTQQLIKHYPTCTILSYHISGKTMIAASPERLLTLQHPDIQSDAVGGTIRKHSQTNQQKSKSIPAPLFKQSLIDTESTEHKAEHQKLLKEHAFIAQDIYQRLDPLCHTLKMPVYPYLMKLHNMYHFETPIQGKLMNQYDIFDIIQTLHPTPAVAGYPTHDARQWLIHNENYDRGWYSGAFGWLEGDSHDRINGELSVMLRCALIQEDKITLFAGAGLVSESDPQIEWLETELKMQTILELLLQL